MERDIMWAPWNEPGLEHLHLFRKEEEIVADSVIIGIADHTLFRLWYEIVCAADWRVKELSLILLSGDGKSIKLRTDRHGHWFRVAGDPISSLDGCIDVDISTTPFTNTLPIRRLALSPGQSVELLVAYFMIPDMELKPVRQRYTCLESNIHGGLYKYESLESGFSAELQVDSDGLVTDYSGLFKRVWPPPGTEMS